MYSAPAVSQTNVRCGHLFQKSLQQTWRCIVLLTTPTISLCAIATICRCCVSACTSLAYTLLRTEATTKPLPKQQHNKKRGTNIHSLDCLICRSCCKTKLAWGADSCQANPIGPSSWTPTPLASLPSSAMLGVRMQCL